MRAGASRGRPGYRPGLDGLRAIAVAGVLGYHAGLSFLPGGFLGVDLFFVLSGFLITSLLIERVRATGGPGIVGFYRRRARRLLPALGLMLAVTVLVLLAGWPALLARARGDLVSALVYVTNWWFVVRHQSYFAATARPSPFEHLWSLAVEEQFYLVWPWVVYALLRGQATQQRLARLSLFAFAGSVASTGWMAVLAVRYDVPYGTGVSRLYYGTDTHAMGLLLGAAAAAAVAAGAQGGWVLSRRAAAVTDALGVVGLAGAVACMVRINEVSVDLYRGGFLAFSALALLAVLAAARADGRFGQALGVAPLRWAGTRSYSLYLWHWPVFVVTRPGLDIPLTGLADLALRLGITVAAAEVSYRYVEEPIRRLGLRPWLAAAARTLRLPQRAGLPGTALAGAMAAVFALAMATTTRPTPAPMPRSTPAASTFAATLPSGAPLLTPRAAPRTAVPDAPVPATAVATPRLSVTAVGDSVMVGAIANLQAALPGVAIDAVEGRQPQEEMRAVVGILRHHQLGRVVVLHAGSNGAINPTTLAHLLAQLHGHDVVLVNDHVPDPWQGPNNAVLAQAAHAHPHVQLVDWNRAATAHPAWLWSDGIHVRPAGAAAYAAMIAAAVHRLAPPPG